jgi:hypothetical protein
MSERESVFQEAIWQWRSSVFFRKSDAGEKSLLFEEMLKSGEEEQSRLLNEVIKVMNNQMKSGEARASSILGVGIQLLMFLISTYRMGQRQQVLTARRIAEHFAWLADAIEKGELPNFKQ